MHLTSALIASLLALVTAPGPAPQAGAPDAWAFVLAKYDANKDGVISRSEYTRDDAHWKNLDVDGDGKVDAKEFKSRGWDLGGRTRKAPKKGAKAPDFDLEALPPWQEPPKEDEGDDGSGDDRKQEQGAKEEKKPERVKLSSFRAKEPVALIFGSYT